MHVAYIIDDSSLSLPTMKEKDIYKHSYEGMAGRLREVGGAFLCKMKNVCE
jgi:hypothetical protein